MIGIGKSQASQGHGHWSRQAEPFSTESALGSLTRRGT